jgi:hypothetical protein
MALRRVLGLVVVSFIVVAGVACQALAEPARAQSAPIVTAWQVNASGATSPVFHAPTGVLSVTVNGERVTVVSADIPGYKSAVTPELAAALASRPAAARDFREGKPAVTAGQTIEFGQDVGFRSAPNCQGQPGYGYWPPGPACARPQQHAFSFPLLPRPATSGQATGLGEIGLWLNGVSVFNWSDAQTYRNQGVWHRTAAVWEADSMDLCGGHSANGDYHSHFYTSCLAQQLGDDGGGPSPLWGFALDGYPIYGPWQAAGLLAKSGWKARDYGASCGTPGERTCLLLDPTDPGKGTRPAGQRGPSTTAIVEGFPGHSVQAVPGAFLEDYGFDASCSDCLDAHNGRDDGDGRGYHYVVTVTQAQDGSLIPSFPYITGPAYAGVR